jgi:uncharacterized phosphatase
MKAFMLIYFVRHGETAANREGRIQGQSLDEPLTEAGVRQVESILPLLPGDFDLLFSSPLKRAKQSAEIIAKHTGKEIIFCKEIMEQDFGEFSGKFWTETPFLRRDLEKFFAYPFETAEGESLADFRKRINLFLYYVRGTYPSKVALVIAHGGVIHSMHRMYPQKEFYEDRNASIHDFNLSQLA